MKKITDYLTQLIDANSSKSSRAVFMLVVLGIGCLLLLIVGGVLIYDVAYDGKVDTDLAGLSAFVAAIGANLGVAGLTKSIGNVNTSKTDDEQ